VDILSILVVAVALGMDAFSVAIAIGAVHRKAVFRPTFRLAFHFGLFQFIMPVIGWVAGSTVAGLISGYDHWIAFGLLAYVGGKMIVDAGREPDGRTLADPTRGWKLILLSVATSIDALAVGFSLALLKVPILYPSTIIGLVAFAMTTAGMYFGGKLGKLFGKRVEVIGGLVLIGIGLKILFEHL
jgi:manganese efflux pump family protein